MLCLCTVMKLSFFLVIEALLKITDLIFYVLVYSLRSTLSVLLFPFYSLNTVSHCVPSIWNIKLKEVYERYGISAISFNFLLPDQQCGHVLPLQVPTVNSYDQQEHHYISKFLSGCSCWCCCDIYSKLSLFYS